jgi:cytochrome P450
MVMFNPLELRTNPYPIYKAMRDADPLLWNEFLQAGLITGYDDVQAILKDSVRFSSDRRRANNRLLVQLTEQQELSLMRRTPTMLSVDPPSHTRMRNLVNKAFTPRAVEKMRPHVQEITEALLDDVAEPGRIDVVRDLAVPLPIIVIAEMLGVSPSDREQFKTWSADIAAVLGNAPPEEVLEKGRLASEALADYFAAIIEDRRKEPRDDLISALIAARDQADLLSQDELLATCVLLLVAGNVTTTNLIGNGIWTLVQHPEERRLLEADTSLITSAVEELLRYESPVQATSRVVSEDMEFRGKQLKKGQILIAFLGAANRDPAIFPDPDKLDLARQENRHLAFGQGIHYCLGAPLARMEGQIAIQAILRRYPEPEPEFEKPDWANSFILRGLRSLPIRSRVPA